MSDELVKILDGNTFVVSDDSGDIEASLTDPTGLFSFDTRFLSKWVLTVDDVAAERALGRRPPVLRDPLLPRPGNRNRLHRREAVGDPAARRRERFPRGADDPQPRREAGPAAGADRRGQRLRRPVRGQGRAQEEGPLREPRRARRAPARLRARDLQARDADLEQRARQSRRERADLRAQDSRARRVDDRARRRRRDPRVRSVRGAQGRPAQDDGGEPRPLARRPPRASRATGSR